MTTKAKIWTKIKDLATRLWTKEQGARFARLFVGALVSQVAILRLAVHDLHHVDWSVLSSVAYGALEVAYRAWRPTVTVTPPSG